MSDAITNEDHKEAMTEQSINEGISSMEDLHKTAEAVLSTPEVIETEVSAVSETDELTGESEGTTEKPATEEYEPNFKYKVKDDEYEFDKFLTDAIKTKEQEEALRDLYTRSKGLDSYKEKLKAREQTVEKIQTERDQLQSYFNKLEELKKFDRKTFYETLGVDPADDSIKLLNLDGRDEATIAEQRRADQLAYENYLLEQSVQNNTEEQKRQIVQQGLAELDNLLANEKYKDVVSLVPNLRDEILVEGKTQFARTRKEPDLSNLVETVANKYLGIMERAQPKVEKEVIVPNKPKGIPRIGGTGASGGKPVISSLDQLKQVARTFNS